MARQLRSEYPGACYHILNRGNYRQPLFEEAGAAGSFEHCIFETSAKYEWRLHAFAIMRNHFHLVLETPIPNLSMGMKSLQGTWANRFNRLHSERGRPFQGRFKAFPVEHGFALAQVCHYVHLNPLRAGIVKLASLLEYRWSSLWWYGRRKRPSCLEPNTVLLQAGNLRDEQAHWLLYRDYLGVLAQDDPGKLRMELKRLCKNWAAEKSGASCDSLLGGECAQFPLHASINEADQRGRLVESKARHWEQSLREIAISGGIDLDRLGNGKSSHDKVLLAARMKATTDVSNGWLCERLGMGTPMNVSQTVRRLKLNTQDGPNELGLRVKCIDVTPS